MEHCILTFVGLVVSIVKSAIVAFFVRFESCLSLLRMYGALLTDTGGPLLTPVELRRVVGCGLREEIQRVRGGAQGYQHP